VDFAFDCTGVIPVIEQLAETIGMLGTLAEQKVQNARELRRCLRLPPD
jgi:hypothetical protein